jgi:hypothetical protein
MARPVRAVVYPELLPDLSIFVVTDRNVEMVALFNNSVVARITKLNSGNGKEIFLLPGIPLILLQQRIKMVSPHHRNNESCAKKNGN